MNARASILPKHGLAVTVYVEGPAGEEISYTAFPPGKWVVCHRCRGTGEIVNPAVDGNGITAEDVEELGHDFIEDYIGGVYDIVCPTCDGRTTVWAIDWERWDHDAPDEAAAHRDYLRAEAEDAATMRHEMGIWP